VRITPLFDRVLLRPMTEELRDSGIYVPQTGTEKSQLMKVEELGPDCGNVISLGDTVIVHKYAGIELYSNEERFIMVKLHDVMGVAK